MSVIQLVWCNFSIKLHPKQKCFDNSCIPFCACKQAADLSRFDSFLIESQKLQIKSNLESNRDLLNRIFTARIESPDVLESLFRSQSRLGCAHHCWLLVVCGHCVVACPGVMDWRAARVELWSVRGNQGNVWIRQRIAFRSTDRTLRVCVVDSPSSQWRL